jgi:hypothetical protein
VDHDHDIHFYPKSRRSPHQCGRRERVGGISVSALNGSQIKSPIDVDPNGAA